MKRKTAKNSYWEEVTKELKEFVRTGKAARRYVREAPPSIAEMRTQMGLDQTAFANLLGVKLRTLQEWEQRRRRPSGPAWVLIYRTWKHWRATTTPARRRT